MHSPGRQLLLILLLWGAGLGGGGQFAKFSVILPEVAALYPGRGAAIGLLVSLVSCVGVILGLSAGVVLNRFGARRTLILSLLLGAVVSLFQTLLLPFPLMLASRILEGLSHLGIVVAAPTLIARLAGIRHRPLAMSLWGTFFGVSFAMMAWLGIPLARTHGVESVMLSHAAYMALIASVLVLMLPAAEGPTAEQQQSQPRNTAGHYLRQYREAYRSPFIAAPSCGWLFYAATFVALLTVLPTLMPTDQRPLVAGVMPLATIFVSMTLGVSLLQVLLAAQVIALGFALSLLVAALFLLLDPAPWLALALAGSLGLIQGASFVAIPQLNTHAADQAIAYGTMAQTGNLGNLVGTPLLLLVLASFGLHGMMALIMVMYLLAIVLHIVLARARSNSADGE